MWYSDWILELKTDINERTGEIQIKLGVNKKFEFADTKNKNSLFTFGGS